MSRRSSQHNFAMAPMPSVPRSKFQRSHGLKSTFDAGYLVPFYIDEVYPGDTFNARATLFGRLATPIVPPMDNAYLDTFFFFVPYRLLWKHWKEFNGENPLAGYQSTQYELPQATATNAQVQTLWDYFGFPTDVKNKLSVSAMPFRAYFKIYNDWFRDENLQNQVDINSGQPLTAASDLDAAYGSDATFDMTNVTPFRRGKRHDYFTSALPWPQKGPGVSISLADNVDLTGSSLFGTLSTDSASAGGYTFRSKELPPNTSVGDSLPVAAFYGNKFESSEGYSVTLHPTSVQGLQYDLSTQFINYPAHFTTASGTVSIGDAAAVTINALRSAFALQRFYEKDARGGTRYTEILRSHFGVVSPDARLQRSEYLGGSSSPIMFTPVMQTSATDDVTPQGNLAAYGILNTKVHGFNKSFTEHGIVIGLLNVRTDLSYQQGVNRMWLRHTREDFYWPEFAHLGEQGVYNEEIYAQGTEEDTKLFGYQERYAELRYHPSMVTGKMRSTYAQPLDIWHFAQKFDSLPTLNGEFIQDTASYQAIKRISAVQDEPQFILDVYMSLICARPMPMYGVPGMIDHF